jgi:hypothetical protein
MNPAFLNGQTFVNGQTFINEQTLFEMMTRPENKVALDAFISMYNSTKDKTPIMESFLSTIHQALIAKNRQEEVFLLSLTLAKTDYNYYLQIAKDHLEGLNGAAFDERKAVDHFAKFLDRHQESNLPSLESVAATQEIIRLTTSEEKISYKPSFAIETLKKLSSTYKSKLENEPLYRDIIQQHLDWLKSQIEEISSKHAPEIEREKEREKQEAEIFHNYLAGTVFKDAKQDSVEDLVAATLLIISKEDFYKNGYDTPEDNFRKFKDLLMSKIPDLEKVLNPEEDAQSVFGSQDFNEYEEMQSGDEEEDVLQPETPRSTVSYPEEEPATKKQRKL